jgi:hypothetical protein
MSAEQRVCAICDDPLPESPSSWGHACGSACRACVSQFHRNFIVNFFYTKTVAQAFSGEAEEDGDAGDEEEIALLCPKERVFDNFTFHFSQGARAHLNETKSETHSEAKEDSVGAPAPAPAPAPASGEAELLRLRCPVCRSELSPCESLAILAKFWRGGSMKRPSEGGARAPEARAASVDEWWCWLDRVLARSFTSSCDSSEGCGAVNVLFPRALPASILPAASNAWMAWLRRRHARREAWAAKKRGPVPAGTAGAAAAGAAAAGAAASTSPSAPDAVSRLRSACAAFGAMGTNSERGAADVLEALVDAFDGDEVAVRRALLVGIRVSDDGEEDGEDEWKREEACPFESGSSSSSSSSTAFDGPFARSAWRIRGGRHTEEEGEGEDEHDDGGEGSGDASWRTERIRFLQLIRSPIQRALLLLRLLHCDPRCWCVSSPDYCSYDGDSGEPLDTEAEFLGIGDEFEAGRECECLDYGEPRRGPRGRGRDTGCHRANCFCCGRRAHCAAPGSGSYSLRRLRHAGGRLVCAPVIFRLCPGCGVPVMRAGGGAHMNCALCHTSFHWWDSCRDQDGDLFQPSAAPPPVEADGGGGSASSAGRQDMAGLRQVLLRSYLQDVAGRQPPAQESEQGAGPSVDESHS